MMLSAAIGSVQGAARQAGRRGNPPGSLAASDSLGHQPLDLGAGGGQSRRRRPSPEQQPAGGHRTRYRRPPRTRRGPGSSHRQPRPPARRASHATIVSWTFVSSRQTAAGRSSPHAAARSRSVAATRPGASYTTVPRSSPAIRSSRSRRSRPDRGRNPSNVHRGPATPDAATAARTADAPGIGTTKPPSAAHAATRSLPGSLTVGVPASVTRARSAPPRRWSSSAVARDRSL